MTNVTEQFSHGVLLETTVALMFPTVEGMRMSVYACFCEVDHDCAPVSEWCEPCQERQGRRPERAASCDRCGWFPAQLRNFGRVLCGRCWDMERSAS